MFPGTNLSKATLCASKMAFKTIAMFEIERSDTSQAHELSYFGTSLRMAWAQYRSSQTTREIGVVSGIHDVQYTSYYAVTNQTQHPNNIIT